MRRLPIFLLCASVVLGACDSGTAISPSPPLLPLEVGNRWVLTRTVIDASGDTLVVEQDTVTVVGDTVLAGELWFALAGSSPESQAGFGGYNTVRTGGVWFRADASAPAYLQYAHPTQPGTIYPYAPHRYSAEAMAVSTTEAVPGVTEHHGHLYSIRFDSLRVWPHLSFGPGVPPLRRLLVPGIGFAEYETQFWQQSAEGYLALWRIQSWRLVEFEPA